MFSVRKKRKGDQKATNKTIDKKTDKNFELYIVRWIGHESQIIDSKWRMSFTVVKELNLVIKNASLASFL